MRPARTPRNPAPALSFTNLGECVRMPIKTPQNRPFRSFKAAARVRVPLGPPTLIKGLRPVHDLRCIARSGGQVAAVCIFEGADRLYRIPKVRRREVRVAQRHAEVPMPEKLLNCADRRRRPRTWKRFRSLLRGKKRNRAKARRGGAAISGPEMSRPYSPCKFYVFIRRSRPSGAIRRPSPGCNPQAPERNGWSALEGAREFLPRMRYMAIASISSSRRRRVRGTARPCPGSPTLRRVVLHSISELFRT